MIQFYQELLNECLDITEHKNTQVMLKTLFELTKYNIERSKIQC